jgi:hypothetical protein
MNCRVKKYQTVKISRQLIHVESQIGGNINSNDNNNNDNINSKQKFYTF